MLQSATFIFVGVLAFAVIIAFNVFLVVMQAIPISFAVVMVFVGLACLWVFPKIGTGFRLELPGGGKLETLVQRAEDAAGTAVASKEEAERLAAQIKQAEERIEAVQRDLRVALKSIAETSYLTFATKNIFPPPQPVIDRTLKGIDNIAVYAIPDEQQRAPLGPGDGPVG